MFAAGRDDVAVLLDDIAGYGEAATSAPDSEAELDADDGFARSSAGFQPGGWPDRLATRSFAASEVEFGPHQLQISASAKELPGCGLESVQFSAYLP